MREPSSSPYCGDSRMPSGGGSNGDGRNGNGSMIGEIRERLAALEVDTRHLANAVDRIAAAIGDMTRDLAVRQGVTDRRLQVLESADRDTLRMLAQIAPLADLMLWLRLLKGLLRLVQWAGVPFVVWLGATGRLPLDDMAAILRALGGG